MKQIAGDENWKVYRRLAWSPKGNDLMDRYTLVGKTCRQRNQRRKLLAQPVTDPVSPGPGGPTDEKGAQAEGADPGYTLVALPR